MHVFKKGDLVGLNKVATNKNVKTGIVVNQEKLGFTVRWTSYDKNFFMEKEDVIFAELNKLYLLSLQYFKHKDAHAYLSLINAS